MAKKKALPTEPERQVEKFRELAKEIGTDDDEAAFEAKVKKLAKPAKKAKD